LSRSLEYLVGAHQRTSDVPEGNLALEPLHQNRPNIASSNAFVDAEQLYYRSLKFPIFKKKTLL